MLSLYGLNVETQIPLPTGPCLPVREESPVVSIQVQRSANPPPPDGPVVARLPCSIHGDDMVEHRGPGGTWIWLHSFGTFHLRPGNLTIDGYPHAHVDDESLALVVAGPMLLFARHRLGLPSLHASAIVLGHRAVGFLGPHGQGKSSIASTFLRHGAELLADDAMPLVHSGGEIRSEPGPAYMKMWNETLEHGLGITETLPNVHRDVDKKLLALHGRYPTATSAARVHALYLLDRYSPDDTGHADITIRGLAQRDALLVLLAHTSIRPYLIPADDRFSIPLYSSLLRQTPVRVLSYPHGFQYQDAVHARILEDVHAV